MPIIHMETDSINIIKKRINQLYSQLGEHYNTTQTIKSKLALAWLSPTADSFASSRSSHLSSIENQINELFSLSISLSREREEWESVDGAFTTRFAQSQDNYKYNQVEGVLFKKGKNDSSDIQYDDLKQHQTGDCYLLASLSAIAESDPDFIRNMIKDNGDGTYTVYFYENGERIEITVDDTFPKGDDLLCIEGQYAGVSGQDKGELWPLVVEKAYAEWKGGYEMIGDGGWPAQTLSELTGRESTEIFWGVPPTVQEQQLRLQELQTVLANDNPIAVGMRPGFNGIDGGHAYSLRNIEGDQVHLYNPHGSDVAVSLEEFYDNCFNIAYASI